MSSRRTPRSITDQVADVEERLRRLLADLAASPADVRLVVDGRGDLLVGAEDNVLGRLGRGPDGTVLHSRDGAALGLRWEVVEAVLAALYSGKGVLLVGAAAGDPAALQPEADGLVLTLDADAPLGMAWRSSTGTDAELLAWLSMGAA